MLASLIFAAAAGWSVTRLEPILEAALARAVRYDLKIDAMSFRVLTFCVALALAAVAVALVRADGSSLLAAVGAALGYFGEDIAAFLRDPDQVLERRRDDDARR